MLSLKLAMAAFRHQGLGYKSYASEGNPKHVAAIAVFASFM
jgi:hypothetical protein